MTRVSVVIPAYNAERYLREAIDSVLGQTHQDLELIVVDDGSTDSTPAILASYGERIRVVTQPNRGVCTARNVGIAAATGEYVAFADADDIQFPFRLAAQARVLDAMPSAAIVGGEFSQGDGECNVVDELAARVRKLGPSNRPYEVEVFEGFGGQFKVCSELGVPVPDRYGCRRVYCGYVPSLFAVVHLIWGAASMFRKNVLNEVGGFDPKIIHFEDWHLAARIGKLHNVAWLDVPTMVYRRHALQYTKQYDTVSKGYLQLVKSAWVDDSAFKRRYPEQVRNALGIAHWQVGSYALSNGRAVDAWLDFLQTIAVAPQMKRPYVDLARSTIPALMQQVAKLTTPSA
jgi:glycosyltransferase involved in cell wall biosynthesis